MANNPTPMADKLTVNIRLNIIWGVCVCVCVRELSSDLLVVQWAEIYTAVDGYELTSCVPPPALSPSSASPPELQ